MDIIILLKYLAVFLATYLTIKHTILRSKVKKLPPSPFLSFPIIGHLYLLKAPLHRSLAQLAARYGPVLYLRLGARPTLILSSPTAVEECLLRNNVFVNRPRLLIGKYGGYNYTTIVWSPYGPHWRNQRRIAATELLSPQRVQVLGEIRADVARAFLRRVMKECTEKGVVDMKYAIFGLTLDNMMRMVFGKSSLEEGYVETKAFRRFTDIMEETFKHGSVSSVENFLPILRWFRVFFRSVEETMKELKDEKDVFMKELIDEHKEMDKEGKLTDARKRAMLHVLLSLQKEDPQYYSDEMIRGLISNLFQAATDTSAFAVVWAFSLLLNHPEVLKKAQAEMDTNVGHKRLVEESDRNKIPYIQCILSETLRMYPSGALGIPYESTGDCMVGGHYVPQGTMLMINIWAIHNDGKIWEDPREFKPERFLGVEDNKLGCKFMPFGVGKRICPGEHLARRMVWLSVATLVQCFDWERAGEEMVDMKEGGGIILTKVEPLLTKCSPRPCMMNVLSQL